MPRHNQMGYVGNGANVATFIFKNGMNDKQWTFSLQYQLQKGWYNQILRNSSVYCEPNETLQKYLYWMNNMKRGCRNNVSTSSRETTKFTTDYKICQFLLME